MNAIILAHGGAQATVDRHRPNWEAAFDGLTFISPADDPLPGSLPIGQSCRSGQGAIERMLFAVCLASRFPECCIMEYDCLIFKHWKGEWPFWNYVANPNEYHRTVVCSEVFPNQDGPLFDAEEYGHCPWIATGETWWKILTAGAGYERGFPDRWLASASKTATVALKGMDGSYSRDRGFDAKAGRIARLAGAPAIHGIKTQADFDMTMALSPLEYPDGQWGGTIDPVEALRTKHPTLKEDLEIREQIAKDSREAFGE